MKVALVSLNQSWENKNENKQKVEKTLALITEHCTNTDLVVYPEMTLTGFTMESQKIKENELSSETITFFKEQAKKHKLSIAFGVVLSKEDKATNNLAVVNEQGQLLTSYAKIHPFSYANENDYYQAQGDYFTGYANVRGVVARGQRLPSGTYFYVLSYVHGGRQETKKGFLYLK